MYRLALLTALAASGVQTQTTFGVYIFSRHGDRTAKSTPPSNLTDLGYQEVFTSGTYFRNRYVASNATSPIAGISPDLVVNSQIAISAPADDVLGASAVGFSQGLYPPVGPTLGMQTLRNGTVVESPLNGYQIIPIMPAGTEVGANQENTGFLQADNNCTNAIASANEYTTTPEFQSLLASTRSFYQSFDPLINRTFNMSQESFANAYTSM